MTGLPRPCHYGANYMTETGYWNSLRKLLKNRVYAWKINANFTAGIPDWWGSGSHQDLWVENKRIKNDGDPPAFLDLTNHDDYLTVLQQNWLVDRYNEGRNVGVLVFSKHGHVYFPGLSWQDPISKLDFIERAMSKKDMAERLINILGELPIEPPSGLK